MPVSDKERHCKYHQSFGILVTKMNRAVHVIISLESHVGLQLEDFLVARNNRTMFCFQIA